MTDNDTDAAGIRDRYAIQLAADIIGRCVQQGMLTVDEGMMVFDSLVDGFRLRPETELNELLLQLHGRD